MSLDSVIGDALESSLGGPLPDRSWIKASLPSSHSGINLRSASLHVLIAFLSSDFCSKGLVESMLGHTMGPSRHSNTTVAALPASASTPDWKCMEDIDVVSTATLTVSSH